MARRVGAAVAVIERMVRQLVASDVPLDRHRLTEAARRLARTEAPLAGAELIESVVDSIIGLGPLEVLLRDPEVSDVLVNGHAEVWVERRGVMERSPVCFPDDAGVVAAVERVIAPLGLRLDRSSPAVDARLDDGSRLHAVVPPASVDGPVVAIRRFTQAVSDLDSLIGAGSATPAQVETLRGLVEERRNIVVSGGTGAGKTTLLNLLAAEIPAAERVVTIEDSAELSLPGHVVRLEAHPANADGHGGVSVRDLLRSALRLRPDRIIVGEVRGSEALDMVWALNTGHRGSLSTVHANSPEEALWRLETLALADGGVAETAVRRQIESGIHFVVQVERSPAGRKVSDVREVGG
ncbi:MAG: CpaF family protein [Actinomycetota bacterium]